MATLKRCHAPVPWGAQVETIVWKRSRSGKPRRKRLDRPPLAHDFGWDWDRSRILFSEKSVVPDSDEEERACEFQAELREDARYPSVLGRTHTTLTLFDIARCQETKRHGKARTELDEFEVIRVPNVVPISEDEPDMEGNWELREWETLDTPSIKRTYSEVAGEFIEGKDPPNTPMAGCSRIVLARVEDDAWEYL